MVMQDGRHWCYGQLIAQDYKPSSLDVNVEVLQLSSELSLPQLAEVHHVATSLTVWTCSSLNVSVMCGYDGCLIVHSVSHPTVCSHSALALTTCTCDVKSVAKVSSRTRVNVGRMCMAPSQWNQYLKCGRANEALRSVDAFGLSCASAGHFNQVKHQTNDALAGATYAGRNQRRRRCEHNCNLQGAYKEPHLSLGAIAGAVACSLLCWGKRSARGCYAVSYAALDALCLLGLARALPCGLQPLHSLEVTIPPKGLPCHFLMLKISLLMV
eukprot:821245-Amphidinium_carterae.1